MTVPTSISPTANYLPDWSEKRFVVLDPSKRWASAISLQVQQERATHEAGVFFESCQTSREALLLCESANSVGLIVFLEGLERECLGLLRRLGTESNQPTVLVVGKSRHAELMPVILEAGVSAFLVDVENDIPIANWCASLVNRLES